MGTQETMGSGIVRNVLTDAEKFKINMWFLANIEDFREQRATRVMVASYARQHFGFEITESNIAGVERTTGAPLTLPREQAAHQGLQAALDRLAEATQKTTDLQAALRASNEARHKLETRVDEAFRRLSAVEMDSRALRASFQGAGF